MKTPILWYACLLMLLWAGRSPAQPIPMRIPDTSVVSGSNIDLPIYADEPLTGRNVLSYNLQITFNAYFLQPLQVIVAGTVSAGFGTPVINTTIPGKITMAAAGTQPLQGRGVFLYIRFRALQPTWYLPVEFTGPNFNFFNEGDPPITLDNGYLYILSPPSITIFPDEGLLCKGEQTTFYVWNGTEPYSWSVTNPAVASIDENGTLTALEPGLTKVVAEDFNGVKDTTSDIEIRAMRLSLPQSSTQFQGGIIEIPVSTTDLTGLQITAGTFSLNFNPNVLTALGTEASGTLLEDGPSVEFNTGNGTCSVSFASSLPVNGSGTLIFIRFGVSATATYGTAIIFSGGLFNEDLIPVFTDGNFYPLTLPSLYVYPQTGEIVAGEGQQFTISGDPVPPVEWSVNDPLVATVSETGYVTALKGGTLIVSVEDNAGATASTQPWTVYDTRVWIPDISICGDADDYEIPVFLGSLPPSVNFSAFQVTINYNPDYLDFAGAISSGTLSNDWLVEANGTVGTVTVAGSGALPIFSSGILVKLLFNLSPGFVPGSVAYINPVSVILNEGTPNPYVDGTGSLAMEEPVFPDPAGVIFGTSLVLQGTDEYFYYVDPIANATGYLWSLPPGAIVSSGFNTNSILVAYPPGSQSGNVTVTGTNACGNGTSSPPFNVHVVPQQITIGTVTITGGQTVCFDATVTITVGGGGNLFIVQPGGEAILVSGERIRLLTGTKVQPGGLMHAWITTWGQYCVPLKSVQEPAEETSLSPVIPWTDRPEAQFRIYPNPLQSDLTIETMRAMAGVTVDCHVFTITGNLILHQEFHGVNPMILSLEDLPAGMYILRLADGKSTETFKIIKTM